MLLGGFLAQLPAGASPALPAKAQALLAYLAVRPGQRHPRDKLAALLWGDAGDAQARGSLRHALGAVRKALGSVAEQVLLADGQNFALDPEAVDVDVVRFERCVTEGTPVALEAAAAHYRGDLLEGVGISEPRFEEWLLAERERLRELAVEALTKLLAHQSQGDAAERAIQTAGRLLALDPLQEVVHRALMRLYVRHGRRGAALKQYQVCVSVLRCRQNGLAVATELGMRPEIAHGHLGLQRFYRRAGDEARAQASLVTALGLFRELEMDPSDPRAAP